MHRKENLNKRMSLSLKEKPKTKEYKLHQGLLEPYIDANLLYNITDEKLREMSLIENLQREDLSLIEEANAFKKLNEEYNKSYRDIAVISGKSKTTIADIINLSNYNKIVLYKKIK